MTMNASYLITHGAVLAEAFGVHGAVKRRHKRNFSVVVRERNVLALIHRLTHHIRTNFFERWGMRARNDLIGIRDVPKINVRLDVVLALRRRRYPAFVALVDLVIRNRAQRRDIHECQGKANDQEQRRCGKEDLQTTNVRILVSDESNQLDAHGKNNFLFQSVRHRTCSTLLSARWNFHSLQCSPSYRTLVSRSTSCLGVRRVEASRAISIPPSST